MDELSNLTVTTAASLIRQRKISPVRLMETLLERSSLLEEKLNIWVTLNADDALESALKSEKDLNNGVMHGPLHGVPVGVKDLYFTKGVKTTACSPVYEHFVPSYNATTIDKLKQAGAIIMGKTITTEFACGDPPPTVNPWNPLHTPGGSSTGSAVGVAARIFPTSLGSQTAGSVLRPASFNGVVGLKPTFGRISRFGVFGVSWHLDTMGTFTRTVEDAALMLNVLAGHDPKDHSSSEVGVPDYAKAVLESIPTPRIGILREFFYDKSDEEVKKHTDGMIYKFKNSGADIREVTLPAGMQKLLSAHRILMTAGAAATHQSNFSERPDDYSPNVRGVIEAGMLVPAVTYLQADRIRRIYREYVETALADLDVILTTTAGTPPPKDLTTTGDPRFQAPWTTCGLPSITVPSGLSKTGLPLGLQLVSKAFDESTLLTTARWLEGVIQFDATPNIG